MQQLSVKNAGIIIQPQFNNNKSGIIAIQKQNIIQ